MLNRAERRARRANVISRRQLIYTHIMASGNQALSEPGKFAKFNLNCGCLMCHFDKHFGDRRKRRELLKHATSEDELLR
jgi:hypothetical protein